MNIKKIAFLTLSLILAFSCSSPNSITGKRNGIGIRQKTQNPNTPYIYKNGYENFEIKKVLSVQGKDSTYINELRFNAVLGAMYTQKLMFDKFGKWDEEIYPNAGYLPILSWEKRKIFTNKEELYTVVACGIESWEAMYASVIVVDSNGQDCLNSNTKIRDSLINYFSDAIINLSSDHKFHDEYLKLSKKYPRKK